MSRILPHHEFMADSFPVTSESIERAKAAARAEREQNGLDADTGVPLVSEREYQVQLERLADMQTILGIARKYGGARVQNWIRNYERGGSL